MHSAIETLSINTDVFVVSLIMRDAGVACDHISINGDNIIVVSFLPRIHANCNILHILTSMLDRPRLKFGLVSSKFLQ